MQLRYKNIKYFIKEFNIPYLKELSSFERGWGNGYVMLPKSHIWYGKDYDDIPINVHGGLTYGEKNDSDYWVIGFDTAHAGDNDKEQDIEYVLSMTRYMVYQCVYNTYVSYEEFKEKHENIIIIEENKNKFRKKKLKRIINE